jgi:uncharacterized UPF0160 family protein
MYTPIGVRYFLTHSGHFHADDVCTAAVLGMVCKGATTVRSRDPAVFAERLGQPDTITFDVGDTYDPTRQAFDHHMPGARKRDDGTTYSAFGLVWNTYGRDIAEQLGVPMERSQAVADAFDAAVVHPIDRFDTGTLSPADMGDVYSLTLCGLVDAFNPAFDSNATDAERDAAFGQAVAAVGPMLRAQLLAIDATLRVEDLVAQAIAAAGKNNPVVILPVSCDAQKALDKLGADHVLYLVYPSTSGGYAVGCARTHAGSFTSRKPFPAHWGGLRGADLAAASGVEDAVFCHTGLFYAAAQSGAGALALAHKAVHHTPA